MRIPRRIVAGLAAAVAVLAVARPATAEVGTIGPQAMEGDLHVHPGDIIRAGISFAIPGAHPKDTVQFDTAVTFWGVECVTGSGGGDILVPMGNNGLLGPYDVPKDDSSWIPTGDQSSDASYQGEVAAPDLCHGGTMTLRNGAVMQADMRSDDPHTANVRFHYSAEGSSGSWSATKTFTPSPATQVPVGAVGALGAAALLGLAFIGVARRKPTELSRV
jgi:hypothetical protein